MNPHAEHLRNLRDYCRQWLGINVTSHFDVRLNEAAAEIERLEAELATSRERLSRAKWALCRNYFKDNEVSEDIAPRIIEMEEHYVNRLNKCEEALGEMINACGSCMNWMDQVSRAKLSSATRGILATDMGMCSIAIFKAKEALKQ